MEPEEGRKTFWQGMHGGNNTFRVQKYNKKGIIPGKEYKEDGTLSGYKYKEFREGMH